ncbi:MAG: cell division protein FtsQ/DivIB [Gammaproteobacteria bacterium]|nr:cell division protein FtsQ/DivIB [Gammaproteobacteria bacterium]MDH5777445.1 cell division protein FtsQ/DivIB [Gammaproteobacteria bacterium]
MAMAKASQQAVPMQSPRDVSGLLKYMRLLLLTIAIVASVVWMMQKISNPEFLPINKVKAQGTFKHVTEQMLQSVLGQIHGGYFSINVAQIKQDVESLPWVDTASVRRVWPDVLVVNSVEHTPLAYWNDKGLVNIRGEVFTPDLSTFKQNLPLLNGPDDSSHMLLNHYQTINELLATIGLQIKQIDMDSRRALILWLDNDVKLILGRNEMKNRLQRFVSVYPKVLAPEVKTIAQIDMRYTNGFAITRKL